jgi:predicted RNase H-like HicB family nuclease
MNRQLTAIIVRDGNGYVSLCPEVDVASQGNTIDEARRNFREALELFFETASPKEIKIKGYQPDKAVLAGSLNSNPDFTLQGFIYR